MGNELEVTICNLQPGVDLVVCKLLQRQNASKGIAYIPSAVEVFHPE